MHNEVVDFARIFINENDAERSDTANLAETNYTRDVDSVVKIADFVTFCKY